MRWPGTQLILLRDQGASREAILNAGALNTATGEVLGKTAARHTSIRFVAFLTVVSAGDSRLKQIVCP
ncbi:hypothetical protein [Paraburkholderia sp. DGU8]|uniref:hypothetical protein n=1 Tax=Paraburkholderia sp. DGU8 TaxID=3161997 RepID=UPI0034652DBE